MTEFEARVADVRLIASCVDGRPLTGTWLKDIDAESVVRAAIVESALRYACETQLAWVHVPEVQTHRHRLAVRRLVDDWYLADVSQRGQSTVYLQPTRKLVDRLMRHCDLKPTEFTPDATPPAEDDANASYTVVAEGGGCMIVEQRPGKDGNRRLADVWLHQGLPVVELPPDRRVITAKMLDVIAAEVRWRLPPVAPGNAAGEKPLTLADVHWRATLTGKFAVVSPPEGEAALVHWFDTEEEAEAFACASVVAPRPGYLQSTGECTLTTITSAGAERRTVERHESLYFDEIVSQTPAYTTVRKARDYYVFPTNAIDIKRTPGDRSASTGDD